MGILHLIQQGFQNYWVWIRKAVWYKGSTFLNNVFWWVRVKILSFAS